MALGIIPHAVPGFALDGLPAPQCRAVGADAHDLRHTASDTRFAGEYGRLVLGYPADLGELLVMGVQLLGLAAFTFRHAPCVHLTGVHIARIAFGHGGGVVAAALRAVAASVDQCCPKVCASAARSS